MAIDVLQVVVFFGAFAVEFGWFGLSADWRIFVLPALMINITLSWVTALLASREEGGVVAFLEYLGYAAFLTLHWWRWELGGVPQIVLDGARWVLPALILVINFGQELGRALQRVPRKVTRGGARDSE